MDFLEEIPMVGAAPLNYGRFPSTPWAVMDFIYGFMMGSFGPLLIKARSGDCFSKVAAFGVGIAGIGKYWDYKFGAGAKGVIVFVSTLGFEVFGIFNIIGTCIKQYNFSIQNPWREVFRAGGDLDPYAIGTEARRQAARKANLKKTNMWPNYKIAPIAVEEESIPDIDSEADDDFADQPEDVQDPDFNAEDVEPIAALDTQPGDAGDDDNDGLDNFAATSEIDKLAKEMVESGEAYEPEMPYGAVDWVYSDWNFVDYAPKTTKWWWVSIALKVGKIVLNGFKMFSAIDGNYYFYDQGRYIASVIIGVCLLINKMTDWSLIQYAKPWSNRGGVIPKPKYWRKLDQRPNNWSRPAWKKLKKYAKYNAKKAKAAAAKDAIKDINVE